MPLINADYFLKVIRLLYNTVIETILSFRLTVNAYQILRLTGLFVT